MNAIFIRLAPAFLLLTVSLAGNFMGAEPAATKADQLRQQLKDPSPRVRAKAAMTLAEANDAEAIPALIDLLADLPAEQRAPIEVILTKLAGEWAPVLQFAIDDDLSRGVRRDAWASWWRRCDGPFLFAALAKHTLTPDKRRRLEELLTQLGSDRFAVRESASGHLLAMGRLALPRLREAVKDRDVEVSRRAKLLIERLETGPDRRLPVGALRLLAVRKPVGAVEAVLAYLPFADDEEREEEVRKSLIVLARRDGQLDPALRRALADAQPKVRIIAGETLIAVGGTEGRAAIRKLLLEDVPSVRFRTALALARAGEREGVSVLIDLLPLLTAEECNQAEEVLHQLAGDSAPTMPEDASDDSTKRRDTWAAWWKVNTNRVDLGRMSAHSLLGYTLICDCSDNRVYEIDRQGKKRWAIDKVRNPLDAVVLPGNRVLIAENGAQRITERDFQGKILWQKQVAPIPITVQRLPKGHTFIASNNGSMLEVDRDGKEILTIPNVPKGVMGAYRSRQGNIVCVMNQNNQLCQVLDATGKQLRSFSLKYPVDSLGCLEVMSDGRILIAASPAVMEYDSKGKLLREWHVPGVGTVTGLPNGHILASSTGQNRVVELDRTGKVVWEHRISQGAAYRARRR